MPKLLDLKFPAGCKTLPEGFWSAVDVWIKKPHVVNKRLCGVRETESEDVGREALELLLLDQPELSEDVCSFLSSEASSAQTHEEDKPWSSSVRTIIPKVNCYGTKLQKELVLKGKSMKEGFNQTNPDQTVCCVFKTPPMCSRLHETAGELPAIRGGFRWAGDSEEGQHSSDPAHQSGL